MLASFFRKFWRDRRGAIILLFGLMLPPMILAAGVAVDFSRLAASRAQLQAAVDGAAQAGVGAYANEENSSNASSVAQSAFTAAERGISGAVTLDGAPTISVGCTATSTPSLCGSVTANASSCVNSFTWCVTVTETATQNNPLFGSFGRFGGLGSSKNITVTATAVWGTPASGNGTNNNFDNFAQSYFHSSGSGSSGTGSMMQTHTSGIGAGSPTNSSSSAGNAYFFDSMNNTAPTFLSYSSLPTNSGTSCTSSPSFTAGTNRVLLVPTDAGYCGLTLGNPPTEEWYYINGAANSGSWINVPSGGNLILAPDTIVCPEYLPDAPYNNGTKVNIQPNCGTVGSETYNNANSHITGGFGYYTPFNVGGSLILNYSADVTPATTNNGVLTFVNDEYDNAQFLNKGASLSEYAYVCPTGATSCGNPYTGTALTFTGPGTLISHDTYISTVTVSNGIDVAYTEQETFAAQFTGTCTGSGSNQQCGTNVTETEIDEVAGVFNSAGANPTVTAHSITNTSGTYAQSPYARDPTTDTSGVGDTTTTNGKVVSTDAYGQLDTACSNSYSKTTGNSVLGGNQSFGGTYAPITLTGQVAADLFALTTDAPPPNTTAATAITPLAYNFTYPNYGYSYVNGYYQGAALETETVYFCGNGPALTVSGGSASGIVVSASPYNGGAVTN